jgi:ATP synthase (C/AC39) subunit
MSVGWESLMFNVKDGFLGAQHMIAHVFPAKAGRATMCSDKVIRDGKEQHRCCCCTDAVVRGHRSGLLTSADYNNLAQCESLDDIKLNLVSAVGSRLCGLRSARAHLLHCITMLC